MSIIGGLRTLFGGRVSCGLPLFLYLRERQQASDA
jgi:hypothetical protein